MPHACSASFDHNGGILISEHYDLKLIIPKGAIKDGDAVIFSVASYLYRPFVLPSEAQADLASPYYWIGVSGLYHFHKPVQVEFECFAVVIAPCDPSHYQLLFCEDDDKSYTMQPVDYHLSFEIQDDTSLCVFKTEHFCSFCLYHTCKDPMVRRVAALFLKPNNFQFLTHFTVEIWLIFHIKHFINTYKTYFEKKWKLDATYTFETSCDNSSTSYFTLHYDNDFDGWEINQSKSNEIKAYETNCYKYYASMAALKESEANSLFPPCFLVNVVRKSECIKDLRITLNISLCKEGKPDEVIQYSLHVPISA